MQKDEFIHTLVSAAAFLKTPLEALASQSLKDTYSAAKTYLAGKLGVGSPAHHALDLALEKPESETRKSLLKEESAATGLEMDSELRRLGTTLQTLLPADGSKVSQTVRVVGRSNHVQVAAGDIVTTARHVRRAAITPDETHLSADQRRRLIALIAEVADRLAGEDGRPHFGAVHAMLQQRFQVASYLLIPASTFVEAAAFLQRLRAIGRSRLRRRNPAAYRLDFLRLIHARRVALGWLKPQLYTFATQKLGLKYPLTSLLALGPLQLKSLAEKMRHESQKSSASAMSDPKSAATDERP